METNGIRVIRSQIASLPVSFIFSVLRLRVLPEREHCD